MPLAGTEAVRRCVAQHGFSTEARIASKEFVYVRILCNHKRTSTSHNLPYRWMLSGSDSACHEHEDDAEKWATSSIRSSRFSLSAHLNCFSGNNVVLYVYIHVHVHVLESIEDVERIISNGTRYTAYILRKIYS